MKDQAEKLRHLVKAGEHGYKGVPSKDTRVIAIASGKGGVGKTSLVVNLGIALGKAGKKVMILDADLGMANVDIMLGIIPKHTLFDVVARHKSLEEIVLTSAEGVKIIPGCSGIFEMANIERYERELLVKQLGDCAQQMEYLLIDSGAGISKAVLGFITAASEVIVVVTPEPTSITDAYGMIKVLAKFNLQEKIYLVVNKARNMREARETAVKIETAADKFLQIKIERLGFIRSDDLVECSIKEMVPYLLKYPRSHATKDLLKIADNIMQNSACMTVEKASFIAKLTRLLK